MLGVGKTKVNIDGMCPRIMNIWKVALREQRFIFFLMFACVIAPSSSYYIIFWLFLYNNFLLYYIYWKWNFLVYVILFFFVSFCYYYYRATTTNWLIFSRKTTKLESSTSYQKHNINYKHPSINVAVTVESYVCNMWMRFDIGFIFLLLIFSAYRITGKYL